MFAPQKPNTNINQVASSEDKYEILNQHNWLTHKLFLREDYDQCLKHMRETETESCDLSIRIKGFIHRFKGDVIKSLQLFQESISNNSRDSETVKHIGKSLYLVGRHVQASRVYESLCELKPNDADVWYSRGLCYMLSKQYNRALECFFMSNSIQQSAQTYLEIAKAQTSLEATNEARDAYLSALNLSPEDPEILTLLGLMHHSQGEVYSAFEKFGNALTYDPRYVKAILAAGSIIQEDHDSDVALTKYRVAIKQNPDSYQLWNNIGMCFQNKGNNIAALSCLKRAYDLNPLAWNVCYNLGLIYLHRKQYASSFHYLSGAVNLNSKNARLYMWVAIVLFYLCDQDNAETAYKKSIKINPEDYLIYLNYTILLLKIKKYDEAQESFMKCNELVSKIPDEDRNHQEVQLIETISSLIDQDQL